MICPYCNTPNPPEAKYCCHCNALLPTPNERRRQKKAATARAIVIAILIPLVYYMAMSIVGFMWMIRFNSTIPYGITQEQYMTMYTEAFNRDSGYLNIIFAGICVLGAAAYYGFRRCSLADAANIRPVPPVKFGSAFACGLTLQIPVGIILSLIPFSKEILEGHEQLMTASTTPMWVQLLYSVILAPIIEELFFRGIAHDRLSKVMPVPLAAAISSIGFAVIHGELIAILVAFVCGYVLALLYSRFKSVLVPIAFHIGFNLLSFIVPHIKDPILFLAAGCLSIGLFIGSVYLLFRMDENENYQIGDRQ